MRVSDWDVIWKHWSGYHRSSLVETKMNLNCFKRLGEKVMARTFERQVTELNIRALFSLAGYAPDDGCGLTTPGVWRSSFLNRFMQQSPRQCPNYHQK